jgi:hypothetical protein
MRPKTGIAALLTVVSAVGMLAAATATAGASTAAPATSGHLIPGDLLVSESYYTNDPNLVAGTGQPKRHRHDLGGHLDRQWRRRPGRRPEQAGVDHRQARRHLAAGRRVVHDRRPGGVRIQRKLP